MIFKRQLTLPNHFILKTPKYNYMKWSKSDELLLADLYLIRRKSCPEIADIMKRYKGAVRAKLSAMSLTN